MNQEINKPAQAKSCKTCSKEHVCKYNPNGDASKHPFFPYHKSIGEFMNRLCNAYGECCREFELKRSYRKAEGGPVQFERYKNLGESEEEKKESRKDFKFELGELVRHYKYPGIIFKIDKREYQEFTPSESGSRTGGNEWIKYICKFERPKLGYQYELDFSENTLIRVGDDPLSKIFGITFKLDKKKNIVEVPYDTWVDLIDRIKERGIENE
jgi:hypothetical protein